MQLHHATVLTAFTEAFYHISNFNGIEPVNFYQKKLSKQLVLIIQLYNTLRR